MLATGKHVTACPTFPAHNNISVLWMALNLWVVSEANLPSCLNAGFLNMLRALPLYIP